MTDFYSDYSKYLSEPVVAQNHQNVLDLFNQKKGLQSVIDLGCGLREFQLRFRPRNYVGIDLQSPLADYQLNYRLCEFPNVDFNLTGFVSLFSVENTAPHQDNYKLYEQIFTRYPSIECGLVSGFYYAGNKENPILEGNISAFQTLESPEEVKSALFSETRVIIYSPSNMFGENVYEVWKYFERIK